VKVKGTYVELGAYTGVDKSNRRFFDECLEGLLIEGKPSMKDRILQKRPHAHKILFFFAPSDMMHAPTNKIMRQSNFI
jgi:hypothetical protein